jgi:putative ABC transport system substrate-binding protein
VSTRITRRHFLAAGIAGVTVPLAAEAQQAGKAARIGYLGVNRAADVQHLLEALRLGLREHGWVEGQNIHIDYRWAEGAPDQLGRLADELVRLKVDLLVVPATQAIQAAKSATPDIPIVMVGSNDPVADGFVASLARPGGNITGLIFDPGLEIGGKHVELLVQAVPKLSSVAVLVNPENRTHRLMSDSIRGAARSFGVQLQFFEARSPDELNTALVAATKARAGAMLVHSDAMLFGQRKRIADFAVKSQLPSIYPWREAADVGGFMSYGANLAENFRRAASFVDRILKGARPADLPIERPTKFELVINLKAARAVGLTIPPSLLARADTVIE